jgi:uncharacterized protein (TIGR03790 family)
MAFCMAETRFARGIVLVAAAALATAGFLTATPAQAIDTADSAASAGASAALPTRPEPKWISVPRSAGRLRAADIGLVINTADPYSVAVGAHYAKRRGLRPEQVLRVSIPAVPSLALEDFERLREQIAAHFGPATQALALAWAAPWAVGCNSITGALAAGFDAALCANSCGPPTRASRYFNSASARPFSDHGFRPSMLLAARDVDGAKALIDRGVAADSALARRGRPNVNVLLLTTGDVHRGVRQWLYPPAGPVPAVGIEVKVQNAGHWSAVPRVWIVTTGSQTVEFDPPPQWAPGGLGDHLTSLGGALSLASGHTTAVDWIASGATASHGAVSEPCNHLQKFPHPQVLLLHYLQGSTAIEAYWKSVAWPQQSLFVGEPLAAPFAVPALKPTP